MKKTIFSLVSIIVLTATVFLIVGCQNCKHTYKTLSFEIVSCDKGGEKIEECTLCGKQRKTKIRSGHKYEYAGCLEYEECSVCGERNDVFVKHSTNNGYCSLCGDYFVSKEIQMSNEYARHEKALANLKSSYDNEIRSINSSINIYKASCIYSKSECISKISSINSQISSKQAAMNSATNANDRMNLQLQIQNLNSQKSQYQRDLDAWNKIESLQSSKTSKENEYQSNVRKENDLHAANLKKIEGLKY